jgi:hypothetical protein
VRVFVVHPLKRELPLSYTVAVVTVLWRFVLMFPKHSSPDLVVLRDFSWWSFKLSPVTSDFNSVRTLTFLSGFLSSSDSLVFSLLTKCYILCLLEAGSPGNWHEIFCDIFQQTHISNRVAPHTHILCWIAYLTQTHVAAHPKQSHAMLQDASLCDSHCYRYSHMVKVRYEALARVISRRL